MGFSRHTMPVATVFENLEAGASIEDIAEWFDVTPGQIKVVLEFAAGNAATPGSYTKVDIPVTK